MRSATKTPYDLTGAELVAELRTQALAHDRDERLRGLLGEAARRLTVDTTKPTR